MPSHRGEDAASGKMTHAREFAAGVPVSLLPPPPPELEQPASISAETLATAANEINEDFFISLPFYAVLL
ncbi:hypothetical protein [Microterricola viridarii]|uniref:hypothetical protein n=1 Tax=Microterricola viridarii TaxID=412690 RepID=UPI001F40073B|nr:hypothetical protein [Microterricola viridarii]